EAHAAEDKRRREEIERRNRLDTLVYEVEKSSKEWVDKLDASLKTRLDKAVEGAKQALRSGAADEISKALEELQQAYSAAGASLYAAQRGAGAPGAGGERLVRRIRRDRRAREAGRGIHPVPARRAGRQSAAAAGIPGLLSESPPAAAGRAGLGVGLHRLGRRLHPHQQSRGRRRRQG